MPENFKELLKQDFSDLEASVNSWQKLAKTLEEAQVRHRHKVTGPLHASGWQGADAGNAFLQMEASENQLGTAQSDVTSIATVLDTVHSKMKEAQEDLRRCVRTTELDGYTVDDHGNVTDSRPSCPTGNADEDAQQEHQLRVAKLEAYRNDIQACLDEASGASWEGMQLLQQIDAFNLDKDYGASKAEEGARKAAEFAHLSEDSIPSKKDPKENAKWWSSLTEQQRQEYLDAYPEKIGWLDGIPSTDRDEANRKVVDLQLAEYEMKKQRGELGIHDQRNFDGLQQLQDALDKADGTGDDHKRLYVLGIDAKGDGRAVVSQGNPETARNVAIQVPGTDNDLGNLGEQIDRVDRLQNAAANNGAKDTAVISWLGYDAPEGDNSMFTTGRADPAGGDLRSFTHGLRQTHEGDRAHMTVLGHSYGSTVVGAGASHGGGLDADDIVVVGSPGMTVEHAKDLNINPDHVWAGGGKDDIVSNHLSGLTLGEDPMEKEFGGKVFEVDTEGHGDYWDKGSKSLANQGRIIAGQDPSEGDYHS
ncbi:alpha/beta hydrolase family protein (plasmid) [Streptomyces sp. BHT-5-2]|uniref:alpha/beta hydrolase n=1 Tax=Streptomyces sp. BHT-5-2 TaxID=2866715 RepID=UPI001C8D3DAB|nr:alpha/beta hydrolase [Streptomyces sp. BHT-5-2]QZL08232.1 alpha/beta hydrolase family protein [Streptomyces sp. BHT-5-2]